MLHGFRLILLIGVFLAIAGSVQSGDWSYSVWIVSILLISLGLSFRASEVSEPQKDSRKIKESITLSLPSSSYFSAKHNINNKRML